MTAKEIRETRFNDYKTDQAGVYLLREIAAQLADLNQNIREVGNVIAIVEDSGGDPR